MIAVVFNEEGVVGLIELCAFEISPFVVGGVGDAEEGDVVVAAAAVVVGGVGGGVGGGVAAGVDVVSLLFVDGGGGALPVNSGASVVVVSCVTSGNFGVLVVAGVERK